MIPPGSIPPMERPKEASILVAQYLEEFLGKGFLDVGKFLEDLQGAPGGQRGEGLAMNIRCIR